MKLTKEQVQALANLLSRVKPWEYNKANPDIIKALSELELPEPQVKSGKMTEEEITRQEGIYMDILAKKKLSPDTILKRVRGFGDSLRGHGFPADKDSEGQWASVELHDQLRKLLYIIQDRANYTLSELQAQAGRVKSLLSPPPSTPDAPTT